MRAVFSLIVSYLLCEFPLHFFETYTYDTRVKLSPLAKTSGNIETVVINSDTIKKYSSMPNALDFAQVLKNINKTKPKFIVSLIPPSSFPGTEKQIQSLVDITKELNNFYLVADNYPIEGKEETLRQKKPFDHIVASLGRRTQDKNRSKDLVTRRMVVSLLEKETIHAHLGRLFGEEKVTYRGQFTQSRSKQTYIKYRPTGTYEPIPFDSLLNEKSLFIGKASLKNRLTNKLIIIGNSHNLGNYNDDYSRTPYSHTPLAMTNLELHANMFDTMIFNNSIIKLSKWTDLLFTTAIATFTVHIVLAANPATGLIVISLALIGFSLLSYLLFSFFGVWVGMVHPFLAIFICYYFSIPYRLIIENRRSWEYYQKHKLLTQVEELKTNFLSMMSHDIKTPIARIQGMTDLLLNKKSQNNQPNLDQQQTESILTIKDSAEELSEFISTILDLGRIENQKVKLKLKPKDINQLVNEIIKKHQFLALKKNIEIIFEEEPLFSINIDIELIRQVFANLIENSIKYSPENSKVLITTEETETSVIIQFADQGQGIPPNEINNIFMKFYRTKLVNSTPIKGSGLGLYLAKYFTDLHTGELSVESSLNQGSTFTVELPNNLTHD